ncbi:plasmid stabilization protein (plasmid) [Clostridium gasigenes]|uniref:plasmid stabilization protein n=1 Tax=Clostridium gasigenes TaxID=94869 RepID=UPI00143839D1|nr:plasmid stabilization protein [Clostridium gasigenes]NKF08824.1 plasmid stabilization protein [Clostridium gasigenes]QSW21538.1 plasmid stabilization protein [Clostridium gasigenes]
MEKEILEILKRLEGKVDENQKEIKLELKEINRKLDGVVEQTADLLEFRSDITKKVDGIRDDLSTVELVTAKNYKDIVNLKAVK